MCIVCTQCVCLQCLLPHYGDRAGAGSRLQDMRDKIEISYCYYYYYHYYVWFLPNNNEKKNWKTHTVHNTLGCQKNSSACVFNSDIFFYIPRVQFDLHKRIYIIFVRVNTCVRV